MKAETYAIPWSLRAVTMPWIFSNKLCWMAFVVPFICFPVWGELVVQGKLEDVVLRQPIKQFTVTPGQPKVTFSANHLPEVEEIHWHENLTQTFKNGQFSWHFTEPLEKDFGTPGDFVLRLDAQGYPSVTSPVIKLDAGIAKLRLTSKRISEIQLIVKPFDDSPLDPLSLRVCQSGSLHATVRPPGEGYSRRPSWKKVPGGVSKMQIINPYAYMHFFVSSDQGFGEARFEQTPPNVVIRLQPWASIEGTLTRGETPVPNFLLSLRRPDVIQVNEKGHSMRSLFSGLSRNGQFGTVQTDEQGRFNFNQVPSGEIMIARQSEHLMRSPFPGVRFPVSQHEGLISTYIEPDSHLRLNIQLSEIVVKGNLQWQPPNEAYFIEGMVEPTDLKVSDPKEGSIEERQKWMHAWYWSEEMDQLRQWFGGMPQLLPSGRIVRGVPIPRKVKVDFDGSFEIRDLAPGSYQITFLFYEGHPRSFGSVARLKGGLHHAFIIPENPAEEKSIDLGEIKVPDSTLDGKFTHEWRKRHTKFRFGRGINAP